MNEKSTLQTPPILIFLFVVGLAVGGVSGYIFAVVAGLGGLIAVNLDWKALGLLLEDYTDKARDYIHTPLLTRDTEETPEEVPAVSPLRPHPDQDVLETQFVPSVRLARPTDKVNIWIADVEKTL